MKKVVQFYLNWIAFVENYLEKYKENLDKKQSSYLSSIVSLKDEIQTNSTIIINGKEWNVEKFTQSFHNKYVKSRMDPNVFYQQYISKMLIKLAIQNENINDNKNYTVITDGPYKGHFGYIDTDRDISEYYYHEFQNWYRGKNINDYYLIYLSTKYYFVQKEHCDFKNIFVLSENERYNLISLLSLKDRDKLLDKYVIAYCQNPKEAERQLWMYKQNHGNYKWYQHWFDTAVKKKEDEPKRLRMMEDLYEIEQMMRERMLNEKV